jgi:hypothetical protein
MAYIRRVWRFQMFQDIEDQSFSGLHFFLAFCCSPATRRIRCVDIRAEGCNVRGFLFLERIFLFAKRDVRSMVLYLVRLFFSVISLEADGS